MATHRLHFLPPIISGLPYSAKGVGEPPVVAAAAAVANAVADATGHRFTELPITSEAIVRAVVSASDVSPRAAKTKAERAA